MSKLSPKQYIIVSLGMTEVKEFICCISSDILIARSCTTARKWFSNTSVFELI